MARRVEFGVDPTKRWIRRGLGCLALLALVGGALFRSMARQAAELCRNIELQDEVLQDPGDLDRVARLGRAWAVREAWTASHAEANRATEVFVLWFGTPQSGPLQADGVAVAWLDSAGEALRVLICGPGEDADVRPLDIDADQWRPRLIERLRQYDHGQPTGRNQTLRIVGWDLRQAPAGSKDSAWPGFPVDPVRVGLLPGGRLPTVAFRFYEGDGDHQLTASWDLGG